jgi:hypothetical protein
MREKDYKDIIEKFLIDNSISFNYFVFLDSKVLNLLLSQKINKELLQYDMRCKVYLNDDEITLLIYVGDVPKMSYIYNFLKEKRKSVIEQILK